MFGSVVLVLVRELLNDLPAPACSVLPQFGELHFWILIVEGADSGVQGNPAHAMISKKRKNSARSQRKNNA